MRKLSNSSEEFTIERKLALFQAVVSAVIQAIGRSLTELDSTSVSQPSIADASGSNNGGKPAKSPPDSTKSTAATASASEETLDVHGEDGHGKSSASAEAPHQASPSTPSGFEAAKPVEEDKANADARPQGAAIDDQRAVGNKESKTPSPIVTLQDCREFIAHVKRTLSDRVNAYGEIHQMLKLAASKEVNKVAWARRAIQLLEGQNDIVLGLFSIFLSDQSELERNDLVWMTRSLLATMQRAEQKQVQRICNMLVGRIRKFVESLDEGGQTNLNSLRDPIIAEDPRYVAVFPTVEALWAIMWACYHYQMSLESHMAQEAMSTPSGKPTAEMLHWYCTASKWLGVDPVVSNMFVSSTSLNGGQELDGPHK